jgi:hypothetical protein
VKSSPARNRLVNVQRSAPIIAEEDLIVQIKNAASQVPRGSVSITLANGELRPTFCDTMTFQRDAFGAPISAGADVSTSYEDAGILVSVFTRDTQAAGVPLAFDSSSPTGGDPDLGTPNELFGGQGRGTGGESNNKALGNILVKAENTVDANGDGLVDDPDDDACGAWFVFDFAQAKCVSRADIVDIESADRPARFRFYDAQDQFMDEIEAGGLGDNSVQRVSLDTCGVHQLKVGLHESGALHDVTVCNEPEPRTQVSFDIDLNNIVSIDFDLDVHFLNGSQSVRIAGTRTGIDPARIISGGGLSPFPIANHVIAPIGVWTQVQVEMSNIQAIAHDGSRMALPGSVVETIDHTFEIRGCGSSHLVADWAIDARIEGDLLGLGIALSFANAADRFDSTGCP